MKKHNFVLNQRFGRLVTVEDLPSDKASKNVRKWLCRCDCGGETKATPSALLAGRSQSCGCLFSEKLASRNKSHGLSDLPEYEIWGGMRARCSNPNHKSYHLYGGRGIKVCPQWDDFATFLKDMGSRPSERHSIDRIDNDGNYSPENCQWVVQEEQSNNLRKNVHLEWQGRRQTIAQWARELNFSPSMIRHRLGAGWSVEKTLSTPPIASGKHERR